MNYERKTYHKEGDYFISDLYLAEEIILKEIIYIWFFYLTIANNCFIIRKEFTEIGSDIYEKRTPKNTNESKKQFSKCY